MSWVAVAIGGGAVIGAAGSYLSAKQANKPKTAKTDQTTTQDPWKSAWYEPDINAALEYQRGVVARGVPQLGPNGQIVYNDQLPWGSQEGARQFAEGPRGGGAGGGGNLSGGDPVKQWRQKRRAAAKSSASTGGGGVTNPATPTAPNYQNPKDVFGEVARRGFAAGDTQTQQQARTATGNILGAAGGGGPEQTGFEGYNPILDRLTGRLESNADRANARDLLMGFLDENNRGYDYEDGQSDGSGNGSGGGAGGGGFQTGGLNSLPGLAPGTGGGSSPNFTGVPDTMAVDSYFGDQTRRIMDEQANEEELAALIAAMNQDTEKGMFRDIAALDAASTGAGRFGGDMWKGMSRDAREEALQEMNKTSSAVRIGDREARRQARLAALQGVNTRDLGLLGANVQREGIAAGERSANASIGAGSAAAADQIALAKRAQDLSAIGQLLGNEEFNLGQLGSVGGQLSSDRMATLGMIPGLEGIGLQGLQTALGAGGGLTDLRGQDVQRAIANQQAGIARSGLNQQAGIWNAGQQQQMVNDYLRTLMNIGSMGGSSRTVGTNVVPGAGISTSGAALQGAAGGAATGAGIYYGLR